MNNTVEAKRLHLYLEGCLSAVSKVTLNTGDLGCLVRILEEFNAKSTVNPVNPPELKTAEEWTELLFFGGIPVAYNPLDNYQTQFKGTVELIAQAMQQAYAAGREDEREEYINRPIEAPTIFSENTKEFFKEAAADFKAQQPADSWALGYAAGWEAGIEEAASVCEFPFPVGITPADRVRALKTKREE